MVLPSKFSIFQSVFDKLCCVLSNDFGLIVSKSKFSGMESFVSEYFFYDIDLCDSNIAVSKNELTFNLLTRISSHSFSIKDSVDISVVYRIGDDEGLFIQNCTDSLVSSIDKLRKLHELYNLQLSLSAICSSIGSNLKLNYTHLYLDSGFAFAFDLCVCFIYCLTCMDGSYVLYKVENKVNKRLDFKTFEFSINNPSVNFILLKEGNFNCSSTGVLYEEICNIIESERKQIEDGFLNFSNSLVKDLRDKGNVISVSISCKDWLTVVKCKKYQLVYDGYSIKWCEVIPRPKLLCNTNSFGESAKDYMDVIYNLLNTEIDEE